MEDEASATIDRVNLSYTWKIKYEDLEKQNNGCLIIRDFSADCFGMRWRLSIYPKGFEDESSANEMGLFIYLIESNKFPVIANVSFHILKGFKGIKHCKYRSNCQFNQTCDGEGTFNLIEFSDLLDKNFVMDDGKVILICDISFQTHISANSDTSVVYDEYLDTLSKDFQPIMKNPNLSDVTLKVGGQELTAHKIILSARSPVFAALFNTDMVENAQSEIKIDDAELDVFKEMLRFIYTGKVKNLEKLAFELYSLADKYELNDLKHICGLALHENLNMNNALDIFVLFDRHSDVDFKDEALEFIVSNVKSIVDTEKFRTLEKTMPSIVIEILRSAVIR